MSSFEKWNIGEWSLKLDSDKFFMILNFYNIKDLILNNIGFIEPKKFGDTKIL